MVEKRMKMEKNAIVTNGITTYYEIHGSGPPLILIHGISLDHNMWQPQISYFSNKYAVITYDIRGHGQSEGSDGDYSLEIFADDLKTLLDNLNIPKPTVCGLSMGGMIAQIFAARYPDQLNALIIADSAVVMGLTAQENLVKLLFPKSVVKTLIRTFKRQFVNFFFWFFRGMNAETKDYFRNALLEFKEEELLKLLDCFYHFDLTVELAKITVPALIIVGEQEKMGFPQAEKMHELIKHSAVVKIPGAFHLSNLENSVEFNRAIQDFVSDISVG